MRNDPPSPSLALGACLLSALAACSGRAGRVDARWGPADSLARMRGAARAEWCPERQVILVEAIDKDRAVGFTWRFATLRPDSFPLVPASDSDTVASSASAALRDLRGQEIRGFQSLSGTLRVSEVDSARISAHLDAVMRRIGRPDTTTLSADFRGVALTRDTTLCHR